MSVTRFASSFQYSSESSVSTREWHFVSWSCTYIIIIQSDFKSHSDAGNRIVCIKYGVIRCIYRVKSKIIKLVRMIQYPLQVLNEKNELKNLYIKEQLVLSF